MVLAPADAMVLNKSGTHLGKDVTTSIPIRRQPYHIPGHAPDEQKEWLHQNLMLQAMGSAARRLGTLEQQMMRLGQVSC